MLDVSSKLIVVLNFVALDNIFRQFGNNVFFHLIWFKLRPVSCTILMACWLMSTPMAERLFNPLEALPVLVSFVLLNKRMI